MMRAEKQESIERENSQGVARKLQKKRRRIRRNQKNRPITHYFTKVQRKQSSNPNIPSQDRSLVEQPDQTSLKLHEQQQVLCQKRDEWLQLLHSQKEERDHYVTKVKAIMSQQLKKMAQIDRIFRKQNFTLISALLNQRQTLALSINQKQEILKRPALGFESLRTVFLQKELLKLKTELKEVDYKISFNSQQQRLNIQEQNCYFHKENWPILSKRYQTIRLIGKGGFSEVYEAFDLEMNRRVAVKLSQVQHLVAGRDNKNDYLRHIKRQYEVHKLLSHPLIVQLIEVLQFDNAICIVLQYCQGLTLAQLLKRQGRLQEKQAKLILTQLLQVVKYLSCQKPSVVHYDLKPQNIMFQQGLPKVLDFGVCKTIDGQHSKMELTSQGIGTLCYLPPETFALNNPTLSNKVDIWSIGVIFYEMLYGHRPFGRTGFFVTEEIDFDPQIEVSQNAKRFIRSCLRIDLSQRLDPISALKDSYFSNQQQKR